MAYILGLWFTDGWMTKHRFCIIQHKKDKYILSDILKAMSSNYGLYFNKNHNCCSMEISSKIILKDISLMGGTPRKSLTVRFPVVPKEYLPDFVRGLWDGDGCITYTKFRNCWVSNFVSGSGEFIKSFLAKLQEEIPGLNGSIHERSPDGVRKHTMYTIVFSRNDTVRLRDYMYGRAKSKLMLLRKFKRFSKTGKIMKIGREKRYYLSFCDARDIVREEKLKSVDCWREYSRTNRPNNIPSMPQQYYKKDWTNWYDFLGKQKMS